MIQPKLTPIPSKNRYCLLEDYEVTECGERVVVPEHFVFDGASIPRVFWRVVTPFSPKVIASALIHDWLHYNAQTSKKIADKIFYELLLKNHVGKTKAWVMYKAVCVGGGGYGIMSPEEERVLMTMYPLIKDNPNFKAYYFPLNTDQNKR